MSSWTHQYIFDLFLYDTVVNACILGTVVAIVSGILGYFIMLRKLSFAGHALTDIGLTGGAGSTLVGVNPLWGLMTFAVGAALGIGAMGEKAQDRDRATGLVLTGALGIGAVFLHYTNLQNTGTPAPFLFGSIFTADPGMLQPVLWIGLTCILVALVLYRPLILCSINPEVAAARGIHVRVVSVLFLVLVAIAVAETAQVVGVLLSTALLIGPAAATCYLTTRPIVGITISALLSTFQMWLSIILSYDSYYWPPGGKGWPVSFFIAAITLTCYLIARCWQPALRRTIKRNILYHALHV